jgi:hypothetical protein
LPRQRIQVNRYRFKIAYGRFLAFYFLMQLKGLKPYLIESVGNRLCALAIASKDVSHGLSQ